MALPSDWGTVRVYGTYTLRDGEPAVGSVIFHSSQLVVCDGVTIVPRNIVCELDSAGFFEYDLPATDDTDIAPDGWVYTVRERFDGGGGRAAYNISVPLAGGDINLATVAPALPVDEQSTLELWQLADVDDDAQDTTDGYALCWNNTTNKWEPRAAVGGASTWGSITGTLSAQTDLQSALDLKATVAAVALKLDDLSAGTADAIVTASADGTLLSRAAYTIASLISHVVARAQHTGTQLAATISDFASAAIAAVTWSTLTGKPSTFDPSAHKTSHATGGGDALTASDIGAQSADATLAALAALDSTAGLVEQTAADTFTKRAMGVAASTSVLTRGDGDTRYATAAQGALADTALQSSAIGSTVQAYDADLTTWAGITPGTGVGTALAVAVGSSGAVVTNGGALGTPSSGTLTNCTFPTLNQNTSGYAEALKSATTTVSVSAATAPSSGQVLTATSSTAATWQTPSGGSSNTKWVGAGELIPRVTNGAGIDGEELSTNKINLDYLAFDSTTAEYAQVSFAWPSGFTTFTAQFHWTAASGSGTVTWTAAARCYADDDALDQAQGTAQSVTDTLLAANDAHKSSATSAVTPGGTVAAGNLCVVQIARDVADTLAVDARLIGVLLSFA